MLPDSGHIQEMENEWKNVKRKRKGLPPEEPIYTAEDAIKCMEIFKPVSYDKIIDIDENIHVRFNDAGHMLGSSIIEVWTNENGKMTKAVFTGDLGNNDIPLLSSPTMIESADYLIMESTYGGRLHMRNDDKAELFLNIVAETLNNGGTVVIPSFAVGRTQEILYEINMLKGQKLDENFKSKYETLMKTNVYVDSPLATSATEVFEKNMDIFDEETQEIMKSGDNPLDFPGLKFTQSVDESKALNESDEPCVIISASGMCEVGRIKHHLKHNIWNPKSTILFVGYQAPGTLGRKIVDGAEKVKIFGEEFSVKARIEYIEGYSGHADQEWLLNFIYSFINKPKTIFLVHGEPEGQIVLKQKIQGTTQIPVIIPEYGEQYELNEEIQRLGRIKGAKEHEEKYIRLEVLGRMQTLKEELEDMSQIVEEEMLTEDANDVEIEKINARIKELEAQIVKIVENK